MTLYELEIELVKRNVSMSLRREAGKWIAHCGTSIGVVGTGKIGYGRDADIEQAIRAMLERFDGAVGSSLPITEARGANGPEEPR